MLQTYPAEHTDLFPADNTDYLPAAVQTGSAGNRSAVRFDSVGTAAVRSDSAGKAATQTAPAEIPDSVDCCSG